MNETPVPFTVHFWEEVKKIDKEGIILNEDSINLNHWKIQEENYIRNNLSLIKDINEADRHINLAFSFRLNKQEGNHTYFDYSSIDLTMPFSGEIQKLLDSWRIALEKTKNPIITSRLSDLIWDFGILTKQKFENHQKYARNAVESYLEIIRGNLITSSPLLDRHLSRALELSLKIFPEEYQDLRETAFEKLAFEEGKRYFYIETFKTLKKLNYLREQITEEIKHLLVYKCEKREDFYGAEYNQIVTDILECFLAYCKINAEKKEITDKCGNGFLGFRSRSERTNIPHFLRIANKFLSKEINSELSKIIEDVNKNDQKNMQYQKFSLPEMSEVDIVRVFIAASPKISIKRFIEGFLIFTDSKIKQFTIIAQEAAPTASRAIFNTYEEQRLVHSTSDDGRVFALSLMKEAHNGPLLEVFDKIIYYYTLNENYLIDMIQVLDFITLHQKYYVSYGISRFFMEEYIASFHVLVSQIESILRHVAHAYCDVSYPLNNQKDGHKINMLGFILKDKKMRVFLGEDLATHLQILLLNNEGAGFDFRNKVAHGLLAAGEADKNNTIWVIHALLAICLEVSEKMSAHVEKEKSIEDVI